MVTQTMQERQALQRRILDLVAGAHRRESRDRIREAGRFVRSVERKLREVLVSLPTWAQAPRPESLPASQRELSDFMTALNRALESVCLAKAAIPPCAPPGRQSRDDIDRAPRLGRLDSAIVAEARRSFPMMTGADLRDLLQSVGLEHPLPEDVEQTRRRQEEALRRARLRKRSRRGTPTVRRRK
jgi:hypothetical protein